VSTVTLRFCSASEIAVVRAGGVVGDDDAGVVAVVVLLLTPVCDDDNARAVVTGFSVVAAAAAVVVVGVRDVAVVADVGVSVRAATFTAGVPTVVVVVVAGVIAGDCFGATVDSFAVAAVAGDGSVAVLFAGSVRAALVVVCVLTLVFVDTVLRAPSVAAVRAGRAMTGARAGGGGDAGGDEVDDDVIVADCVRALLSTAPTLFSLTDGDVTAVVTLATVDVDARDEVDAAGDADVAGAGGGTACLLSVRLTVCVIGQSHAHTHDSTECTRTTHLYGCRRSCWRARDSLQCSPAARRRRGNSGRGRIIIVIRHRRGLRRSACS
jgi:hypothetical protein